MKTKRELLLSRRGEDWNWLGWRLTINELSSKEQKSRDAEDPGGKAGVMSRVPTPACVTQELQAQGSPETREAGLMQRHEI